jgi:hypothetical protein
MALALVFIPGVRLTISNQGSIGRVGKASLSLAIRSEEDIVEKVHKNPATGRQHRTTIVHLLRTNNNNGIDNQIDDALAARESRFTTKSTRKLYPIVLTGQLSDLSKLPRRNVRIPRIPAYSTFTPNGAPPKSAPR